MSKLIDVVKDLKFRHTIYWALTLRIALAMLLFTLCRVGFYLYNLSYFPHMTLPNLLLIMVGGLRFDLAAVLYTNLLFILLMILPFEFRYNTIYQRWLKWLFIVTNSVALSANVADFIYFKFTGRRTTADVFQQFENETNLNSLLLQFLIDYWYALLFLLGLIVLMVWLYNKVKLVGPVITNKAWMYVSNVIAVPFIVLLFVVGVRGDLLHSTRPITLSDAGKYVNDPGDVSLVLNTPFSIYRTLGKTKIKRVNYYSSEEELNTLFSPIHKASSRGEFKKMNVVVIVLESFSKEFFGFFNRDREGGTYKGYTPFLDSLLQHSRTFKYSFANGRKSIDALPAVVASIPSMGIPYVLSPYSGNKINSLGTILKKEGYETSFFHGAPNGSMGFQAFMNIAGIDQYYGMDEYNNDDDYDGWWGIWDEKFMEFMADTQAGFSEPFLSVFFSVSSHHPFRIPVQYEDTFKGGREPILRCIQYTDNAVKRYFAKVSKLPWYKNTLFVVTADHISSNVLFEDSHTAKGLFSIPILFFRPDNSLAKLDTVMAQQADIMPTALGYLNYSKEFLAFGRDINGDQKQIAWNYKDDVHQFYMDDYLLQFDGKRSVALYNFKTDLMLVNNLIKTEPAKALEMEKIIKAIIQQYNNRMVSNNLTIKK